MTIAMIWLHRILPTRQRYSLPPREIIVHLAEKAGVQKRLGREARAALTLINHFGFGATAATNLLPGGSKNSRKGFSKGPDFWGVGLACELFWTSSCGGNSRVP